jgi:hypothetical protein
VTSSRVSHVCNERMWCALNLNLGGIASHLAILLDRTCHALILFVNSRSVSRLRFILQYSGQEWF